MRLLTKNGKSQWWEIERDIRKGHTFTPLHHLSENSFEDTLHFDYVSWYACPSILKVPNSRSERKSVSWFEVDDKTVNKHNHKPSKGNFYQSSLKEKTGVAYKSFEVEELRLHTHIHRAPSGRWGNSPGFQLAAAVQAMPTKATKKC